MVVMVMVVVAVHFVSTCTGISVILDLMHVVWFVTFVVTLSHV